MARCSLPVMAGLVPAIHVFVLLRSRKDVDARDASAFHARLRRALRGHDDPAHPIRRKFGLAALIVLGLTSGAAAQAQSALPQGEGRDLVAVACTQCHALTPIISTRNGPAGWRRYVYNMVLRGAQLRASEAETVIDYLSANFGPGLHDSGRVTLPTGPGKELVETRCTACHDLERVGAVKRSKQDWQGIVADMVGRGAAATADEVQTIVTYLGTNFGIN